MFALFETKWRRMTAAFGVIMLILSSRAECQERGMTSGVIKPDRTLALVIANEAYPLGPLMGIRKNALALAHLLDWKLGFDEVTLHLNVGAVKMKDM